MQWEYSTKAARTKNMFLLLVIGHQILMNKSGTEGFVPTDVPSSQKGRKLQKASRRNEA